MDQFAKGIRAERRREQEALGRIASPSSQPFQLSRGFDTLGNDFCIEVMGELNNRLCDDCVTMIGGNRGGKASINFDRFNRIGLETGERGMPFAEIVHLDADTGVMQIEHGLKSLFHATCIVGLVHLQLQAASIKAGACRRSCQDVQKRTDHSVGVAKR